MTLKAGMQHWVLEYYQIFSNDDSWLTLTYFTARSDLVLMLLYGEKVNDIIVYDIIVGRCSQINEYMKLFEYQRSKSLIDLGPNLSDSIFLNFFASVTTRPIEAKFHVELPWDGATIACSNGTGHMIKMAAMPIYGKNL